VTPAELVAVAIAARERAFAPYSGFRVGAALEADDGAVIAGCNVESASYGLTICAERVALVKAVSDGHTRFRRIAVVADTAELTPPCGACRQLLWEFAPDATVILANLRGDTRTFTMRELLPHGFDARLIRKATDLPPSDGSR
jgi:cytidine deaminase